MMRKLAEQKENESGSDIDISPPWRRGGVRVFGVVILGVLLVISGFIFGSRASHSSVVDNADLGGPATAWTQVSERAPARASINGSIQLGRSVKVTSSLPQGASAMVVTKMNVRTGDKVRPDLVLAIVSGRPVILVRNQFPFYRDLHFGDSGADVLALQRILRDARMYRGRITGVFSSETQIALSNYYTSLEVDPALGDSSAQQAVRDARSSVSHLSTKATAKERHKALANLADAEHAAGAWLPNGEFAVMNANEATVTSAVKVGSTLSEGASLVQLTLGEVTFKARADALAVKDFHPGSSVEVTLNGTTTPLKGTVSTVGDFDTGDGSADDFPGHDVTVTFETVPDVASGSTGTISPSDQLVTKNLAVPLTALSEDSNGTYVLRRAGGSGTHPDATERVPVTVLSQADGWALVDSSTLHPGDQIAITP